jgi:hypothetical protein
MRNKQARPVRKIHMLTYAMEGAFHEDDLKTHVLLKEACKALVSAKTMGMRRVGL